MMRKYASPNLSAPFYHDSSGRQDAIGKIPDSVVSFPLVMKKNGLYGLVSLLVVGALFLLGCRSGADAEKAATEPAPTATVQRTPVARGVQVILPEPTAPPPSEGARAADVSPATPEPAPTAATPAATPTEAVAAIPEVPAFIEHTVQRGETLLGIAVENGVSMAAIQLANQMGSSIDLWAGQILRIPSSTQWLDENYFWVIHVVETGETLVSVANQFDLTVDDILRVNAIADPDLIHPDQTLVLPMAQLVTLMKPQPTQSAVGVAVAAAPEATDAEAAAPSDAPQPAAESPPPADAGPLPSMPTGPADWPGYILARINQARADKGLHPLTLVGELSAAAQAHAEDCARRGWGSHVGTDGAVLRTRLERVGYIGKGQGENWVQARSAERAFDWWYGEIPPNDPHRRNILSPRYTEIGIGVVQTGLGYIFVTDFGRR
jgi:uncharacterized protein YkwD